MSWRRRPINRRRWAQVRRTVFERDGHRCGKCGKAGRLEAHHLKPLHLHPDQDPYDLDGIETRCRACHIDEHRRPVTPAEVAWRALVDDLMHMK